MTIENEKKKTLVRDNVCSNIDVDCRSEYAYVYFSLAVDMWTAPLLSDVVVCCVDVFR